MWGQATRALLADGRDHWQHGPIDLIIELWGDAAAIDAVKSRAWQAFSGILPELARELTMLRLPLVPAGAGACDTRYPSPSPSIDEAVALSSAHPFSGVVAQRMRAACQPFSMQYITPMAAVAGSVADEVMTYFAQQPGIRKACINNGGDIALWVASGESLAIGVVAPMPARLTLDARMSWRGVATSGWRGRSFSLGVADAVTVLGPNAARADAAATMIANAVNIDHPAISRAPADSLKDDTDLGSQLVTTGVGELPDEAVAAALGSGVAYAECCLARGLIAGALLQLQGQWHTVGATTFQHSLDFQGA